MKWFHGPQSDETCSVYKGPRWSSIELRLKFEERVNFLSAAAAIYIYIFLIFSPPPLCFKIIKCEDYLLWGVGSVFESKIVASLNRQLWLLLFLSSPLKSVSNDKKKRHKKVFLLFKIYFWCLKQFEGGECCEALALGYLWRFFSGGWVCSSQVFYQMLSGRLGLFLLSGT